MAPAKVAAKVAGKSKAESTKRDRSELERAADEIRASRTGRTGTVDRSVRRDAGRALREQVPRAAHGDWAPAPDRPDPVALLVAQGEHRVADLLPIRYGRMAE